MVVSTATSAGAIILREIEGELKIALAQHQRGRIRQCAIDQAPWHNLTRVGQEQWRSSAEDNPFLPGLCFEQQAISYPERSLIH